MLNGKEPYVHVERNLRHAMQFYAGSTAAGEIRAFPGVEAISCGLNYPVFNSALLSSSVPGIDGDLTSRIAMPSYFFRALGLGWSYWLCHDLLDRYSLERLREICQSYSMAQVLTAPGMYTTALQQPRRALPDLDVREVSDAASRTTFAHLVATIFDLPFQMTMEVYNREESWTADYWGFIGYCNDYPVSIAMLNVTDDCAGFYSVGTLPGHRRRGFGEALMRVALDRVRKHSKFSHCVLQSSTAGRRLYEQMGFREVTRFSVFRSMPG